MTPSPADLDPSAAMSTAVHQPRPGPSGAVDARSLEERALGWLLLIAGVLGAAAAFVLTVEKIALLEDPDYVPSCSVNPVLNCGSIMRTDQAEVLGFPNPLIGLVAFPTLIATGAALLAGAKLRSWYWLGLQAGATLGLGFVAWLIFQSLYRINALCPYCMVVWAVVIPVFLYITSHNLAHGHFGTRAQASRLARLATTNHAIILTIAFLLVISLITHRFWDYWSGLVN